MDGNSGVHGSLVDCRSCKFAVFRILPGSHISLIFGFANAVLVDAATLDLCFAMEDRLICLHAFLSPACNGVRCLPADQKVPFQAVVDDGVCVWLVECGVLLLVSVDVEVVMEVESHFFLRSEE